MKTTLKFLLAGAVLIPATQVLAQWDANREIAAPPRTLELLNEYKPAPPQPKPAAPAVASNPQQAQNANPQNTLVAPPRTEQNLSEYQPQPENYAGMDNAGTTTRPQDGIVASPRLREQLESQGTQFQIAPIK